MVNCPSITLFSCTTCLRPNYQNGYQFLVIAHRSRDFFSSFMVVKVRIFWEGHLTFVLCSASQNQGGDFAKICVLLRIYELYKKISLNFQRWKLKCPIKKFRYSSSARLTSAYKWIEDAISKFSYMFLNPNNSFQIEF